MTGAATFNEDHSLVGTDYQGSIVKKVKEKCEIKPNGRVKQSLEIFLANGMIFTESRWLAKNILEEREEPERARASKSKENILMPTSSYIIRENANEKADAAAHGGSVGSSDGTVDTEINLDDIDDGHGRGLKAGKQDRHASMLQTASKQESVPVHTGPVKATSMPGDRKRGDNPHSEIQKVPAAPPPTAVSGRRLTPETNLKKISKKPTSFNEQNGNTVQDITTVSCSKKPSSYKLQRDGIYQDSGALAAKKKPSSSKTVSMSGTAMGSVESSVKEAVKTTISGSSGHRKMPRYSLPPSSASSLEIQKSSTSSRGALSSAPSTPDTPSKISLKTTIGVRNRSFESQRASAPSICASSSAPSTQDTPTMVSIKTTTGGNSGHQKVFEKRQWPPISSRESASPKKPHSSTGVVWPPIDSRPQSVRSVQSETSAHSPTPKEPRSAGFIVTSQLVASPNQSPSFLQIEEARNTESDEIIKLRHKLPKITSSPPKNAKVAVKRSLHPGKKIGNCSGIGGLDVAPSRNISMGDAKPAMKQYKPSKMGRPTSIGSIGESEKGEEISDSCSTLHAASERPAICEEKGADAIELTRKVSSLRSGDTTKQNGAKSNAPLNRGDGVSQKNLNNDGKTQGGQSNVLSTASGSDLMESSNTPQHLSEDSNTKSTKLKNDKKETKTPKKTVDGSKKDKKDKKSRKPLPSPSDQKEAGLDMENHVDRAVTENINRITDEQGMAAGESHEDDYTSSKINAPKVDASQLKATHGNFGHGEIGSHGEEEGKFISKYVSSARDALESKYYSADICNDGFCETVSLDKSASDSKRNESIVTEKNRPYEELLESQATQVDHKPDRFVSNAKLKEVDGLSMARKTSHPDTSLSKKIKKGDAIEIVTKKDKLSTSDSKKSNGKTQLFNNTNDLPIDKETKADDGECLGEVTQNDSAHRILQTTPPQTQSFFEMSEEKIAPPPPIASKSKGKIQNGKKKVDPHPGFAKIMGIWGAREANCKSKDAIPFSPLKPELIDDDSLGLDNMDSSKRNGRVKLCNIISERLEVDSNFKLPVFEKTEKDRDLIRQSFEVNFAFSDLTPSEVGPMVDAFEKVEYQKGETIAQQGEPDCFFYVVQNGEVSFNIDGELVANGKAGDVFGELALVYSCDRAASVKAEDDQTSLLRLHETDYRQIRRHHVARSVSGRMKLLTKIPFFKEADEADLLQLSSAMEAHVFKANDNLTATFKEAPFCLIQEGSVTSSSDGSDYGPGGAFGEENLSRKCGGISNVVALTDGVAYTIDRQSFEKVFGDMNRIALKSLDKKVLREIRAIKAFKASVSQIDSLARQIADKPFKAGENIFVNNQDMIPSLYIVRNGMVKTVRKNGKEDIITAGGHFGHEYLMVSSKGSRDSAPSHVKAKYTATAMEDCVCGVLTLQECVAVFGSETINTDLDKAEYIALEDLNRHRVLGEGHFGIVWLVTNSKSTNFEPYALKIQMLDDDERAAADCIKGEISMMRKLEYPFIVKLINTYEEQESISMLLGLAPGGELFDQVHYQLPNGLWDSGIGETKGRFYCSVIADTLSFMHIRGFVFRDLKPENVLIDKDGYPLLTDFGFTKHLKKNELSYTMCGTPNYLPPEIIKNTGHGPPADNWSLGVLIYEVVQGENPFYYEGLDQLSLFHAICDEDYYPLQEDKISSHLEDLIDGLLEKNPSKRLGSFREKDILAHPWFADIDIRKLRKKEIEAPWVPDPICLQLD